MLKKFKDFCLTIGVMGLVAAPIAVPAVASADITGQICNGVNSANGNGNLNSLSDGGDSSCASDTTSSDTVQHILTLVVNIFSLIVGFIAVIMIIVGGIKYITSGGDSSNISGAKNTIVYAIIGLVIVALAQVLVRFVLAKTASAVTG